MVKNSLKIKKTRRKTIRTKKSIRNYKKSKQKNKIKKIRGGSMAGSRKSNPEGSREPPDCFVCPITKKIMEDPVVTIDGHTYEREAIEQWLEDKDTSPFTKLELSSKTLIPNHTLRNCIDEYRDQPVTNPEGSSKPPHCFLCPITKVIMRIPVVTIDGFTYEREAIEKWLEDKDTSPFTNLELSSKTLIPNHTLRSCIDEYRPPPKSNGANELFYKWFQKYETGVATDLTNSIKYGNIPLDNINIGDTYILVLNDNGKIVESKATITNVRIQKMFPHMFTINVYATMSYEPNPGETHHFLSFEYHKENSPYVTTTSSYWEKKTSGWSFQYHGKRGTLIDIKKL